MTVQVMTLTYDVEAGDFALFRAAVIKHAELARKRETVCMRFDVNFGAERQTLCLTYAVFVSGEALDHHLTSDHFHLFEEMSRPWVISRVAQYWELGASGRLSTISS